MTRFILVVAALFSVACAASLNWRIEGGSKAEEGQFPHQITLFNHNYHSCGGSIISEEWILTAAHCVVGADTRYMFVVAGTNDLSNLGEMHNIHHYIVHSGFDLNSLKNDIALVKISEKLRFTEKVQPIALETADVVAGTDLVLSGWGWTSSPSSDFGELHFLDLKVISNEDCNESHASSGRSVDGTQLCTLAQPGEATCFGDAGGPLVGDGKLAGVLSWGRGRPCAVGYPDVFTRVSSYVGWISENTQ